MLEEILTGRPQEQAARERQLLSELLGALTRCQASDEDLGVLKASIHQLDELFLLVVVGEFNAGKSSFINALLGKKILPDGVTPTTTRIHHLAYGEEESRRLVEDGIEEILAPVPMLEQIHIVDTPGTNALDRQHEVITSEFVPRSDLVLFITSADRPFTESERSFMERIREWGKKLVLVVNKVDILRQPDEIEEIHRFVAENATKLLGFAPEIFTVSAKQALAAKEGHDVDADQLSTSGFESLESYLATSLNEKERVRLKLLNPLGVGLHLGLRYQAIAGEGLTLLREDLDTLKTLQGQLDLYREDLGREFRFRLTDVDNLLLAFEKRGLTFFDENLRVTRALDLLNKSKIKADFEREVIADMPRQIEQKVDEIIDWMVAAELRQWQGVQEHLVERRSHHAERLMGELGQLDYNRRQLLDTVGRATQRAVESYDREVEARRMAESVQTAVAGAALLEVGAIGLGAIVTMLATTQLADLTGILAAGTLAVLGLFVLPARRKRAKSRLTAKALELQDQLMETLKAHFDRELDRSVQRIREAVAPYSRFVRAEETRLSELREGLEQVASRLELLKAEIEES